MNQNQSFAAFIGLDKSDKKINVTVQQCGKSNIERSIIKGGAEALHVWVAMPCVRFPGNGWPSVWNNRQPGSSMR
jgi:hypothetical protein